MTITVKDAFSANVVLATVDGGGVSTPVVSPLGYDAMGDKLVVGTTKERLFSNFFDFDTTNDWEVLQTSGGGGGVLTAGSVGSAMANGMTISSPAGGAAAGATPYVNIASGITANAVTVILSRQSFNMPLELRYQISASQRIANNALRIGFVEVDSTTGAIVTSTGFTTAPAVLNARNAAMAEWSGVTATSGSVVVRAAGSAIDTVAAAYGAGYTTVANGSSPNWIAASAFGLTMERDRVNARGYTLNVLTNAGVQVSSDRVMPNPLRKYRLAIIVENGSTAPASTTDWRLHLVNMMDGARLDVSPRSGGNTDITKAFPVNVLAGALSSVTFAANQVVTPAVPATPFILNSAAGTNATLILTGTSGLQALYATNAAATTAYVKLYNKATAPTVGTDTPAIIVPVPAAAGGVPGRVELSPGFSGYRFALGLGLAITGGAADSDVTAVAAGDVKVTLSRTI